MIGCRQDLSAVGVTAVHGPAFLMACCLMLSSSSARAEGEKFVVLPTLRLGDVALRAKQVSDQMQLALIDRSLNVAPPMSVDDLLQGEFGAVCGGSARACAEAVGEKAGATKVIWSTLTDESAGGATSYGLQIEVFNLRTRLSTSATRRGSDMIELVGWAEQQALSAAGIEPMGALAVTDLPVGAEILADGVAVARTPLLGAIKLPPGRHEIEIRYADAAPWRGNVTIVGDETVSLRRCLEQNAVVECSGAAEPESNAMLLGGLAGAGAGVAIVAVGGIFSAMSADAGARLADSGAADDYRSTKSLRTMALIGLSAGGVLALGAGAMIVASVMME